MNEGVKILQSRLPPFWEVTLSNEPAGDHQRDWCLEVQAPDQRRAVIVIEVKRRMEPRGVLVLANQMKGFLEKGPFIVVSPYLSPGVRQRLREASIGYVDLTGNIRIALEEPGLYIETQGADRDPDWKERSARSLRGSKAGRIIRVLLDYKVPPGVRELGKKAGVDPGYVSRVLSLLNREALIDQQERGRIAGVDWVRLLRRWAEEAPLSVRGEQTACLAPRGLNDVQTQLAGMTFKYAITGTLAALKYAPVAPPRLAIIYVENTAEAIPALELKITDSGANVILIEPNDPGVFVGASLHKGLNYVAVSQTAADLLTGPGRNPAEAEELIDWMAHHEELWRG